MRYLLPLVRNDVTERPATLVRASCRGCISIGVSGDHSDRLSAVDRTELFHPRGCDTFRGDSILICDSDHEKGRLLRYWVENDLLEGAISWKNNRIRCLFAATLSETVLVLVSNSSLHLMVYNIANGKFSEEYYEDLTSCMVYFHICKTIY